MKADIIVDLAFGDSGKGKICKYLTSINNHYTHVVRYNGSGNAGHTIIHKDKKFITHQIPSGIFYGIRSIIGSGCVVHPRKFLEELENLESNGIKCRDIVKIAFNTHIITDEHISEDDKVLKIGTTKSGNGGAYRDKFARTGIRAESIKELQPYLVDLYEEFYNSNNDPYILFEGAQGFGLDIDWGPFYPYLTSSNCTVGAALNNGVPYTAINKVYGVAKCYDTYVGTRKFQPEDEIFNKLQEVGKEFGATTGRKRQVNWLNLDLVTKAALINGVNTLVFNKIDILREVGVWNLYYKNNLIYLKDEKEFTSFICKNLPESIKEIKFSDNPERI